ncbi:MAG TPA: hypothetical protein VFU00_09785 [Gemmatimonadales bacterium]|nr:hypothetical protein [Gemmatimonadales bacterium]
MALRLSLALLIAAALTACGDSTDPGSGPDVVPATLAVGSAHACRIAPSGKLACWGRGSEGQLGSGDLPQVAGPRWVDGGGVIFRSVVAGRSHTCALDEEGAAYCWGAGDLGQLGVNLSALLPCGAILCSPLPAPAGGAHRFVALAAGDQFTCGLEAAGTVWCWGLGDVGQLGQTISEECGGTRCSFAPVQVQGELRLRTLSAGRSHVCGLTSGGDAVCWGYNYQGQLGRGDEVDSPEPRTVSTSERFVQLSAGGLHTCAVTAARAAHCWGIDALGAGSTILESTVPVPVAGGATYSQVEAGRVTTCAIRSDGLVECWGTNLSSEMGFPEAEIHETFPEPVRTGSDLRLETIAGEYLTYCGIAPDDGTWCWGAGEQGQLGSGNVDSADPLNVPLMEEGAPAARAPRR